MRIKCGLIDAEVKFLTMKMTGNPDFYHYQLQLLVY
jgi:hypothetical protein